MWHWDRISLLMCECSLEIPVLYIPPMHWDNWAAECLTCPRESGFTDILQSPAVLWDNRTPCSSHMVQGTPWIKAWASLHNKTPDTENVPGIWMKTNPHPLHGSPCSLPTLSAQGTAQHQRATTSQTRSQRWEHAPIMGFLFTSKGWTSGSYTSKHTYVGRLTGRSNEDEFSLPAWCKALTGERQDRRFAAGSTHSTPTWTTARGRHSLPFLGDLTPSTACSEIW